MPVVGSYSFRTGVSAFFGMATSDARAVLPEHLEPIEVTHQRMFYDVPVKEADLDVVVETMDADHVREVIGKLEEGGFTVRLLRNVSEGG